MSRLFLPGRILRTVAVLISCGAAAAPADDEQLYQQYCKMCHEQGGLSAPMTGDRASWGEKLEQSDATLLIKARQGPHAYGNIRNLDDRQLQVALSYMLDQTR